MKNKEPERSWGAVVIDTLESPRHYLLVMHAEDGHWDHPKGHPEKRETPKETAAREIYEETGIRVQLLEDFFTETSYTTPLGRPKKVGFFLALGRGEREREPAADILTAKWCDFSEAMGRITWKNGREVLKRASLFLSSEKVN